MPGTGQSDPRSASRVRGIEPVEQRERMLQELIVIAALLLGAGEGRRHPSGVGDRNPTHVEVVDEIAQPPERVVTLEIEALQEHLERDARLDVGERRAVEIEPDGMRRQVRRDARARQRKRPGRCAA